MQETSDIRIAFIDISYFDDGSYRGALLVADERTRPFEFRATSPIKPTTFQKILHGGTLTPQLYDSICLPLIASAKEQITAIFTLDKHILALRPQTSYPIVHIFHKEQTPEEIATNAPLKPTFRAHQDFQSEVETANKLIRILARSGDLFEPFERVKLALAEIHQRRPEEKQTPE